jgi:hypothetical protein
MWRRCEDPKRPYWKDYGGRGIRVCVRWESFQLFLVDMGARPSPLHTLDRRDNNGNYTPENCRWATRKEQARNRRSSALYTAGGVTRTIAEWSEVLGKKASTLQARLSRAGSDPEKILVP